MFRRGADVGEKKRKKKKTRICYLRFDYDGGAINFKKAAILPAINSAVKEIQPLKSAIAITMTKEIKINIYTMNE